MSTLDMCRFADEACLVCGQDDNTEDSKFGERLLLMCSSCSFRCIHVVRPHLTAHHWDRRRRRVVTGASCVQGCEEKRTQTNISEATAMDPENLWFCSAECERVHRQFEPLVRSTVLQAPNRTIEVVGTSGRKRGGLPVYLGACRSDC